MGRLQLHYVSNGATDLYRMRAASLAL